MKKNLLIKIGIPIAVIAVSFFLSNKFDYTDSKVICYDFVLTTLIAFFSIGLAIVALLFTILDKFKESVANIDVYIEFSQKILKSISDAVIAILLCIIVVSITLFLDEIIQLISFLNIKEIILISTFIISLLEMIDIAMSIHMLVNNVMSRANAVDEDFKVSLEEKSIIEASRHLNVSGLNELKDYIKLLIIKQNIDKDAKK